MRAIRSTLNHHRYLAQHREQRRLEQELAEYRSPAERQELNAMLSRHTAEEIAPLERILNRQASSGRLAYNR